MIKEYRTIQKITGPLVAVKSVDGVACGELAEIELPNGGVRPGRVLEVSGNCTVLQLFESADGIGPAASKARFLGHPFELAASGDMLGRAFNGIGKPIDGGPEILADEYLDINGIALNPAARELPDTFIQTGVSAIDGLNPLVLGQKLPIFSGSGLPHAQLAMQIARQAKVLSDDFTNFAIVFAAIGITFEESEYFIQDLNKTGALGRTVIFASLADAPATERVVTPRLALTAAEYLAFEMNMHVLVIISDMTNYADTLREISAAGRKTPGRGGYPTYLHTDFASLYERAGCRLGKKGSVTLLPILTMPGDDSAHPIPDTTGYAAEGQVFLSRDLHCEGISPPVDVLSSISRLRDNCLRSGKTREDHRSVANQLLSAYSAGCDAGNIMAALGECALSPADLLYAKFAKEFENRYVSQGYDETRTIEETLKLGWELLSLLPKSQLTKISPEHIEKYLPKREQEVG